MRVVVALGGNALLRRGQELNAENQRENIRRGGGAIGCSPRKIMNWSSRTVTDRRSVCWH